MKKTNNQIPNLENSISNKGAILIVIFIFVLFPLIPFLSFIFSISGIFLLPVLDNMIPYESRGFVCTGSIIVYTLISYLLWFLFGKDEHVTPIVNIKPPQNTNSAELEVDCYGCSSQRGVNSLVYYLASKGYLKIEKSDDEFFLKKLKSYDGKNEIEKIFFDGIFTNNAVSVNLNRLVVSNAFYFLCINIQNRFNQSKKNIFNNDKTMVAKIFVILFCILGIGIAILYALADYSFRLLFVQNSWALLLTLVAIWFAVYFCCNYEQMKKSVMIGDNGASKKNLDNFQKHRGAYTIFFVILVCLMLGGIPLFVLFNNDSISFNHPIQSVFGFICLIISFICVNNMQRLSKKGKEIKGKALGFKKFLEVTEKRRFEELLEQNPNYAQEIYSYAFALGVTDSFMSELDILAPGNSKGELSEENLKQIYELLGKRRDD